MARAGLAVFTVVCLLVCSVGARYRPDNTTLSGSMSPSSTLLPSTTLMPTETFTLTPSLTLVPSLSQNSFSSTLTLSPSQPTATFTATVTPPPTASRTSTQSQSLSISTTLLPTESATLIPTPTATPSFTMTRTMSLSETSSPTASVEMSATVTLPHLELQYRDYMYEDALRLGEPEDDRVVILYVHGEELNLERARWDRDYWYRCVRLDLSHAPSMQPFIGLMWTQESPHTLNQSHYLIIAFFPVADYKLLWRPSESLGLSLSPSCLLYKSELNFVNITILPGPSVVPAQMAARRVVEDVETAALIFTVLSAITDATALPVMHITRTAAISSLTVCAGKNTRLSFLESAWNMTFTGLTGDDAAVSRFLGAELVASVLLLGVLCVHLFLVSLAICRNFSRCIGQRWAYGMALMQFPSRSAFSSFWLYPVTKFAAIVFFSTRNAWLLLAAFSILLPWLFAMLFALWAAAVSIYNASTNTLFVPKAKPKRKVRDRILTLSEISAVEVDESAHSAATKSGDGSGPVMSPLEEWALAKEEPDPFSDLDEDPTWVTLLIRRFVHPREQWHNRFDSYPSSIHPRISSWLYFVERFGCFFSEYRRSCYWYFVFDLLLCPAIGLVEGIGIGMDTCTVPLWIITGLLCVYFLIVLVYSPFSAILSTGVYSVLAFGELVAALFGALSVTLDWSSGAVGTQVLVIIIYIVAILLAAVRIFAFAFGYVVEALIPGRPWRRAVTLVVIPFYERQRELESRARAMSGGEQVVSPSRTRRSPELLSKPEEMPVFRGGSSAPHGSALRRSPGSPPSILAGMLPSRKEMFENQLLRNVEGDYAPPPPPFPPPGRSRRVMFKAEQTPQAMRADADAAYL